VLVAADRSERSATALERAMRIAHRLPDADIHLVEVVSVHASASRRTRLHEARVALVEWAQGEADRVGVYDARRLHTHVRAGDPAREVLALAEDLHADLLVIGAPEPRVGWRRFLPHRGLATTALRLANEAPCAVLIADPPDPTPPIEPPCPDCVIVRTASAGNVQWCAHHSVHHPHAHTYHFTRAHPYETHDSEVTPTGVDLEDR
jgi:nucleotide-binding universal stress UspA family protein